jgi:IS30 family transposase
MDNDPKLKGKIWNTMRADATHFIHSCDTCKKMSEKKLTSHVDKYVTADHGIMKCLAIDAIHMPKTKSGNNYILTVIDTFTRYTTLYAIKDLTALTAAKTLINHMCVYGVPCKITADNSTEFEKNLERLSKYCKLRTTRPTPIHIKRME